MSYFMTGGLGKEHGTNKPPPTGRVQERSTGDRRCQSICPPQIFFAGTRVGWAMCESPGRTLSQNYWPETTWKLILSPYNGRLWATKQSSPLGAPLPFCPPPGRSFLIKSVALSACVFPWTIYFGVLDESPLSGPGRGPPSCNRSV